MWSDLAWQSVAPAPIELNTHRETAQNTGQNLGGSRADA